MIDPYKTPQVEHNVSAAKVKTAFHALAQKYHHDKHREDQVSGEKFNDVLALNHWN